MIPLVFECPRTGAPIDAGVAMDQNALAAAGRVTVPVYCPHCGATHALPLHRGQLSEAGTPHVLGEAEPPKAPALAIAINALRISLLKRGLRSGVRSPD